MKKKNKFMKNIFEDAKFGDVFVDAYGCKLKFIMSDENEARLLENNNTTGRQYIWSYKLDGTTFDGKVGVLYKETPKRQLMYEEYLLTKGFIKKFDDILNIERFVSLNKRITVWNDYTVRQHPYDWYVHVSSPDMDTVGILDFAYIDEFETFLKFCGIENYE